MEYLDDAKESSSEIFESFHDSILEIHLLDWYISKPEAFLKTGFWI